MWGKGPESEYRALFLACESHQSVCGSTLMNALYRGGQTGMAMDEKGYSQWQGSGMSEVSWLWSHGQQVLLRNSVMVSAGAAGGLVPLFRSVGVDEAAQIDKTGQFEAGPGLEGKYFFQT